MKKYVVALMLFSMAVVTLPAYATYTCTGTLTNLTLMSDGSLNISITGGTTGVYICKLGHDIRS